MDKFRVTEAVYVAFRVCFGFVFLFVLNKVQDTCACTHIDAVLGIHTRLLGVVGSDTKAQVKRSIWASTDCHLILYPVLY